MLDEANQTPLGGVLVTLLTRQGEQVVRTLSDGDGRFTILPPAAAEYFIAAERFGYRTTQSPLLALGTEGSAPLELLLAPEPIGLEGLEVSVEDQAVRELDLLGIRVDDLGSRWITRNDIAAIPVKRDIGSVLERKSLAGVQIRRPGDAELCVSLQRGRTGSGQGTCALMILNGVPVSGVQILALDPESVETMAVLQPVEATTYYGPLGYGGALLVWTRRGG